MREQRRGESRPQVTGEKFLLLLAEGWQTGSDLTLCGFRLAAYETLDARVDSGDRVRKRSSASASQSFVVEFSIKEGWYIRPSNSTLGVVEAVTNSSDPQGIVDQIPTAREEPNTEVGSEMTDHECTIEVAIDSSGASLREATEQEMPAALRLDALYRDRNGFCFTWDRPRRTIADVAAQSSFDHADAKTGAPYTQVLSRSYINNAIVLAIDEPGEDTKIQAALFNAYSTRFRPLLGPKRPQYFEILNATVKYPEPGRLLRCDDQPATRLADLSYDPFRVVRSTTYDQTFQ